METLLSTDTCTSRLLSGEATLTGVAAKDNDMAITQSAHTLIILTIDTFFMSMLISVLLMISFLSAYHTFSRISPLFACSNGPGAGRSPRVCPK